MRSVPVVRCMTSILGACMWFEVNGLRVCYGMVLVVEDVSFAVGGELVVVVGCNGMGKTMLCCVIVGICLLDVEGLIALDGIELIGWFLYCIC